MSYYIRESFAAAANRRNASEKELLMAGRYMLGDLMRIVLEYTRIDPAGIHHLLNDVRCYHCIDDMKITIGNPPYSDDETIFKDCTKSSEMSIRFSIKHDNGIMLFYIDIIDLFTYIACGDIPEESDAMRVIRKRFANRGPDPVLSCYNGLRILRSFFDYCIWPINNLDAPIKLWNGYRRRKFPRMMTW